MKIYVVCEGQTEETFVRDVMAPGLRALGLTLVGEQVETSEGHRGGALNYDRVRKHLRNRLLSKGAPVVTTFFDLYRLDKRFPGYEDSLKQNGLSRRLSTLTTALHADVVQLAGCMPQRFIPFIQPYEFEALLFSDVGLTVSIEQGWSRAAAPLQTARDQAESPEHINDGEHTKPAARLKKALTNPGYHKPRHGPIAAQLIGLSKIEAECKFFAAWAGQLRALVHQPENNSAKRND